MVRGHTDEWVEKIKELADEDKQQGRKRANETKPHTWMEADP